MTNISDIANAIGQKRMAVALGVGVTAVSNAVARGHFPSSWYFVVSHLAGEAGVQCPPSLFRMKVLGDLAGQPSNTAAKKAGAVQ